MLKFYVKFFMMGKMLSGELSYILTDFVTKRNHVFLFPTLNSKGIPHCGILLKETICSNKQNILGKRR